MQSNEILVENSERFDVGQNTYKMNKWRNMIAFWILGLCNNYGYVVMLSAAYDILANKYGVEVSEEISVSDPNKRDCNNLSTGAILLADIVPSLLIKITAPFFPLAIHIRMVMILALGAAGYILVAAASAAWMAILGVVCTAFASGLGEATLLSYMAFYKERNVISTWSSGTGGAGIFGSLTYAGLTSLGLSPSATLYSLLSITVLMGIAFWIILEHPKLDSGEITGGPVDPSEIDNAVPVSTNRDSFTDKLFYIPNLFHYMIPIGLVYFFEYFINQGLYELIQYDGMWLTHKEQYRWYQVDYQLGVFISRSSINVIKINKTWILAVLQGLNVFLFVFESVYFFLPSMYVVLIAVLWEGLLGGAAYVNTFHKISLEVPPDKREFSMAITSLADALGITCAGFLSMPVHNYICSLPKYVNK